MYIDSDEEAHDSNCEILREWHLSGTFAKMHRNLQDFSSNALEYFLTAINPFYTSAPDTVSFLVNFG